VCQTNGLDATKGNVYYTEERQARLGLIDLTCVIAAVGRIPMGDGRYGIFDRSTEESWPTIHEETIERQGSS